MVFSHSIILLLHSFHTDIRVQQESDVPELFQGGLWLSVLCLLHQSSSVGDPKLLLLSPLPVVWDVKQLQQLLLFRQRKKHLLKNCSTKLRYRAKLNCWIAAPFVPITATTTDAALVTLLAGYTTLQVSRLLDLIVHSLYSHKEVFLRELVRWELWLPEKKKPSFTLLLSHIFFSGGKTRIMFFCLWKWSEMMTTSWFLLRKFLFEVVPMFAICWGWVVAAMQVMHWTRYASWVTWIQARWNLISTLRFA